MGVLKAQSKFQEEREELSVELWQHGNDLGSAGVAAAHLPLDARGFYERGIVEQEQTLRSLHWVIISRELGLG